MKYSRGSGEVTKAREVRLVFCANQVQETPAGISAGWEFKLGGLGGRFFDV